MDRQSIAEPTHHSGLLIASPILVVRNIELFVVDKPRSGSCTGWSDDVGGKLVGSETCVETADKLSLFVSQRDSFDIRFVAVMVRIGDGFRRVRLFSVDCRLKTSGL